MISPRHILQRSPDDIIDVLADFLDVLEDSLESLEDPLDESSEVSLSKLSTSDASKDNDVKLSGSTFTLDVVIEWLEDGGGPGTLKASALVLKLSLEIGSFDTNLGPGSFFLFGPL